MVLVGYGNLCASLSAGNHTFLGCHPRRTVQWQWITRGCVFLRDFACVCVGVCSNCVFKLYYKRMMFLSIGFVWLRWAVRLTLSLFRLAICLTLSHCFVWPSV